MTPGLARVHELVQLLQERDRVEVLAAAELVRDPLARLARVVEVEHRRDRVDPQAVGVVLAQPEERVREQEVLHLGAPEVEDERAPVGMRAAPRIGVLVERRAVEPRERPLVAREVRRHPVEQHADPVRVQVVDEVAEVVGRAERRERRVVAGHLVAPRARVRVVHHRQQLDVREAEVAHVRRELVGELAPAEALPPRRRMHLVDRHRPLERLLRAPPRRSSRRPARRAPTGRRPTRSSAAPRPRTRAGRPSRARRGGTCSAGRSTLPARSLPRSRSRRPG